MSAKDITLTPDHLKGKSIFIATPCYGGKADVNYVSSLMRLVALLYQYKVRFYLSLIGNESLITRARNTQAAQFMAHPDKFSHMMLIDSDIEFQGEDILRMLFEDKDILCGAYPLKCIPPKTVVKLKSKELVDGKFYEVVNAGTGFMMIKKRVFEKMHEAYPQYKYNLNPETMSTSNIKENLDKYAYTLFETQIEEMEDGTLNYLSEDYFFCRRWQDLGGKVLIDPDISLNHVGTYTFKGQALSESKLKSQE